MKISERPTLQDMMKAAMEATVERVDINTEASRQFAAQRGEDTEKVASVDVPPDHYSSDHIEKMASALDYIAGEIKVADDGNVQQPGQGPGALDVLEATSSEENIDAGESGRAITQNLPKEDPPTQKEEVQVGNANTGMDTNDGVTHPEQPLKPIKNENASIAPANPLSTPTTQTKTSSALAASNMDRLRKIAGVGPTVNVSLIRKLAEDALSPAGIEAGKQDMPDYSASEQSVPAQPADVKRQARSMLGSNEAAINYTKAEAKADPTSDVNQVLAQPAHTKKNDPVLHKVLDNTGAAGVKISSASVGDSVKVAAARALLSNMMDKAASEKEQQNGGKKKEKESMMGGAPASPSAASGFTASSLS